MMPRIGDVLERESRTVDLERGDPFERLLARRERKQRNQRIRAGAVAVIVALATGIILVRSLTSHPIPANPPVEPKPAPAAPGTLAYALDGDIYVADPDGSNAVRIAGGRPAGDCGIGEYWEEGSLWSPDGRYLAYHASDCSSGAARGTVVISDTEGNVVATFPGEGWHVAWSPDSMRVAVWDRIFETIGVYGLDGVRQMQLTVPPGMLASGDHDPVWKPDGTALMVPNVEFPLDGGPPRQLWPAGAGWTTYSPDGSRVAYVTHRSLMVARSDGSEPREVFGHWSGRPVWSPTGDRVAFTTNGPDGGGDAYLAQLRVLDVATGSVTPLIDGKRGPELWILGFSPGGDRILFSKEEDLWSIGVDGSDARLLVAGTTEGEWLARSP